MAKKSKIIYFDGPDGAGKTTQLKLTSQALIDAGHQVHITRVLGGTPLGELLREAVLSDSPRPVTTDLHIAMACHYALAADLKHNHKGIVTLIDRSPLSVIAYQVYGDGLDSDIGFEAADELMAAIKPDLTLLYMASATDLSERRHHRNNHEGHNFFENKPIEYHERVIEGYKAAADHFKPTIIDATLPIDDVTDLTLDALAKLIKL